MSDTYYRYRRACTISDFPTPTLTEAIAEFEDALSGIRTSAFHEVIGRDFLHHVDEAAEYLSEFWAKEYVEGPMTRIYCEMEEFTINTRRWRFHALGYCEPEEVRSLAPDGGWISDYDCYAEGEVRLKGMEPVQKAFEGRAKDPNATLLDIIVWDLSYYLVVLRFDQLIAAAHRTASEHLPEIASIPIFSQRMKWRSSFRR